MINTWGKEEITKLNYEFRQDGIYDKKTSKKLKLKFLEYDQGLSMNFGFSRHNISIDFEKKIMEGCINKNMTNKDIPHVTMNLKIGALNVLIFNATYMITTWVNDKRNTRATILE